MFTGTRCFRRRGRIFGILPFELAQFFLNPRELFRSQVSFVPADAAQASKTGLLFIADDDV